MNPVPPSGSSLQPAADAPAPAPRPQGSWWRKALWIGIAIVLVAPFASAPALFIAALIIASLDLSSPASEIVFSTFHFGFVAAAVFFVARWGLRRGWHLRTGIILGCLLVIVGFLGLIGNTIERVNRSSKDKAVLCNVRQLAAAADQYFLENVATHAALSQLVGPTLYVKAINPVAGETYPAYFTQGVTITVTGVAGARTITYAP